MTKQTKSPMTAFHKAAVANVEKTKKDVALEKVDDFLLNARADINTYIASKKAEITKAEAEVAKLNRAVDTAKSNHDKNKSTVTSCLQSYMENWNYGLTQISSSQVRASEAQRNLDSLKEDLTIMEEIKTTLG